MELALSIMKKWMVSLFCCGLLPFPRWSLRLLLCCGAENLHGSGLLPSELINSGFFFFFKHLLFQRLNVVPDVMIRGRFNLLPLG